MTKKAKRGRPRSENRMVHTAIVLPVDLLGRLKIDAQKSGRGMSTEIRERLQLTYLGQGAPQDPETNNLLAAIRGLADTLNRDLGAKWHRHPYAFAAFKAGAMELLGRYEPEGDGSVRPDAPISAEPNDPADVVGRTHARLIGITNHETEQSYDPTNYYDETSLDARVKREPSSSRKKLKD